MNEIKAYIRRRQTYLTKRLDAAKTPVDKGRILGIIQAVADLKSMTRQLRVSPTLETLPTQLPSNLPKSRIEFYFIFFPGISPFSAAWLLAEVDHVARFPSARAFLSFYGCCPRTVKSVERTYSAHVTRGSNKYVRTIF